MIFRKVLVAWPKREGVLMNSEVVSERRGSGVGPRPGGLVAVAKAYLKLAPAFPPKRWTAPQPLERAQIEYDDEVAGGFLKWFPGVNVRGLSIFDIGSGYGGRPARYRELGARKVTGVEVLSEMVEESRAFAESKGLTGMEFHVAEEERLPFGDESFDLIASYDVFGHVHEVDKALDECMRVLRPGGGGYWRFFRLTTIRAARIWKALCRGCRGRRCCLDARR